MRKVPLEDAYKLVHLYAAKGSPKFERTAVLGVKSRDQDRTLAVAEISHRLLIRDLATDEQTSRSRRPIAWHCAKEVGDLCLFCERRGDARSPSRLPRPRSRGLASTQPSRCERRSPEQEHQAASHPIPGVAPSVSPSRIRQASNPVSALILVRTSRRPCPAASGLPLISHRTSQADTDDWTPLATGSPSGRAYPEAAALPGREGADAQELRRGRTVSCEGHCPFGLLTRCHSSRKFEAGPP